MTRIKNLLNSTKCVRANLKYRYNNTWSSQKFRLNRRHYFKETGLYVVRHDGAARRDCSGIYCQINTNVCNIQLTLADNTLDFADNVKNLHHMLVSRHHYIKNQLVNVCFQSFTIAAIGTGHQIICILGIVLGIAYVGDPKNLCS